MLSSKLPLKTNVLSELASGSPCLQTQTLEPLRSAKQAVPQQSATIFEWSHFMVPSFYRIKRWKHLVQNNKHTGKCCSVASIWMVTLGRISSTGSKVKNTLYIIINSLTTRGKYCSSVAFIQMDTLQVLVTLISSTSIFTSEVILCSILISITML